MKRRWTNKEVKLLEDAALTDEEIAKRTGRTIKAIVDKRSEIKRGYFVKPVDEYAFIYNPFKNLTKEQKIARINDLADKLMVKIAR